MRAYEPDQREGRERGGLVGSLVFLALSLLLLVLPEEAERQLSWALRSSVLAPFIQTQEALVRFRARSDELERLRAQLAEATATLVSQRTIAEENDRLRGLLGLRERAGPGVVGASAIWPETRGSESVFLLDVGSEDGVSVNDPVMVAEGLVGVVRQVGRGSALVMDWTHPDFAVSAMTVGGEAFGLVAPLPGSFREDVRLVLNGVPFYAPVEVGMQLVTDGRGSVYPRGIPIGTISGLAEAEAGWRKSYWVEPAARPGTAAHVLVLVAPDGEGEESLAPLWDPEGGGSE